VVSQGTDRLFEQMKASGGESAEEQGKSVRDRVEHALERQTFSALLAEGYLDKSVAGEMAPDDVLLHIGPDGKPDRFKTTAEIEASPEAVKAWDEWHRKHAPTPYVTSKILPRYLAELQDVVT
jgi:hypothetical protein